MTTTDNSLCPFKDVFWGLVKADSEIDYIKNTLKKDTDEYFYSLYQKNFVKDILDKNIFIIKGKKGAGKSYLLYNLKSNIDNNPNYFYHQINHTEFFSDEIKNNISSSDSAPVSLFWKYKFYQEIIYFLLSQKKFNRIQKITFKKKRIQQDIHKVFYNEKLMTAEEFSETSSGLRGELNYSKNKFKNLKLIFDRSRNNSSTKKYEYEMLKYHDKSLINHLENIIVKLLKKSKEQHYYLAFDDLDGLLENVNNREKFLRNLHLMVQAIKEINMDFKNKGYNILIIIALRPEIMDLFSEESLDSSSDFKAHIADLKWRKLKKDSDSIPLYEEPLAEMLLKKYKLSNEAVSHKSNQELFSKIFKDEKIIHLNSDKIKITRTVNAYNFIRERTFERPRDIIDYLDTYKSNFPNATTITVENLRKCEDQFSESFWDELKNELNFYKPNIDIYPFIDIISEMGEKDFSKDDILSFLQKKDQLDLFPDINKFLKILYQSNFLCAEINNNFHYYYIDNKKLTNTNTNYKVHFGLWKQFNLYK